MHIVTFLLYSVNSNSFNHYTKVKKPKRRSKVLVLQYYNSKNKFLSLLKMNHFWVILLDSALVKTAQCLQYKLATHRSEQLHKKLNLFIVIFCIWTYANYLMILGTNSRNCFLRTLSPAYTTPRHHIISKLFYIQFTLSSAFKKSVGFL